MDFSERSSSHHHHHHSFPSLGIRSQKKRVGLLRNYPNQSHAQQLLHFHTNTLVIPTHILFRHPISIKGRNAYTKTTWSLPSHHHRLKYISSKPPCYYSMAAGAQPIVTRGHKSVRNICWGRALTSFKYILQALL